MQLEHSFTVPVSIGDAWKVLLDVRKVAPCMPGATVDEVHGDEFTGTVKVRVGPISLVYTGKARFLEKDESAHRVVIEAAGKDKRGAGTAAAKVTGTLSEKDDTTTEVSVLTDLNVTGKPAQFGRGVMVDVGNKLIGQFADCLASKITGGELDTEPPGPAAAQAVAPEAGATEVPAVAAPSSEPAVAQRSTPDEIDLLAMAPKRVKQVAALGVGALLVGAVVWFMRRRRRG